MAQSREVLPDSIVQYIEECVMNPHSESQLISVLHKVQQHFGYLGREQMDAVAQLMQIPTAKVTGVATFYHFFRLQPRGRYIINVCMGTACYVKGADRIAERLKEELGIDFGETSKDGLFTLEKTRCLGTCGLAPVIMIDDQVHGEVTLDQISGILEKAIRNARS
jgi:NADH:ubiquinone oxidoreductase subunit E